MERQLRVQRADLLAVTIRRDGHGAIHVPELRRVQQRQRRNALARSQLKGVGNQCIVLVAANLDFVGIALLLFVNSAFTSVAPTIAYR